MNQASLRDHADMLQYYLRVLSLLSYNKVNHYTPYQASVWYHLDEIVFELSNSIYNA
jgi:hypothetical protein